MKAGKPIFRQAGTQMSPVNSGVTGPKFTKFLNDLLVLDLRPSSLLMRANLLWNAVVIRQVYLIVPKNHIFVTTATSLEQPQNECQTNHSRNTAEES